jgi:hypothetical protein
MKIEKVEADRINDIWLDVRVLLKKPLERGLGEYSLNDLRYWLKEDYQQLWVGLNDKKDQEIVVAATTQIFIWPNQSHLRVHLCGGKEHRLADWWESWEEPFEKFCREKNIHYIEIMGRDGWIPSFKKKKYFKYYTVMVKEIDYANI